MRTRTRTSRIVLLASAALAAALLVAPAASASGGTDGGGATTWKVTIDNLTPPGPGAPGSQPLSPPLLVVHTAQVHVWQVGQIASHVVAAIAEDANNAPAESALAALPGVHSVATGAGGPIPSGGSRMYQVQTRGRFDRLSVVSMLVNTNDAFTGLDALRLHGPRLTIETPAWDAGSERNNELAAFIPGPCCGHPFVRDPEGAVITLHGGITGVGDLDPALYNWHGAAARITLERA